ncbi:hypothetical protein [Bryobacter aggregatus]|uniref:hypothetical protein n=1 Tax=Bryobacter aggregatus TaxID=360054 RepID=UPI0004E0B9B1|nr:hypothetical protein [Bryobacter aggregatus]
MSTSNAYEHLTPEQAEAVGYERTEPNAIKIGFITFVIVLTIIGSCLTVYYWYIGQLEYTRHLEVEVPIWQELREVRAGETERLTQYKYIDKAKGTVQLPIERAMQLLVQEANAGKTFYGGNSAAVKPHEEDPNLQAVIDKALGKPTAPPAETAAPETTKK